MQPEAAPDPGAMSPAMPLVLRLLEVMKREPVLFVTLGYLAISFIGLWGNYWFFRRFGLPVLEYMQASDFLVAGLRKPVYAVVLVSMLAFAWLVSWPDLFRKRHPQRVEHFRRRWWGRVVFNNSRMFRWLGLGMAPETGLVFGFVWGAIWVLFAVVMSEAEAVFAGGGEAVAVTLASQADPLPGEIRLLGTSSAFVFLWWPEEKRAEAVPIDSIARIAAAGGSPVRGDNKPRPAP